MTCCNPLQTRILATIWLDGTCTQVIKQTSVDPATAVATVTYLDYTTMPPVPITGAIELGPCVVGEKKAVTKDIEAVTVCDPDGNPVLVQYDMTAVPPAVLSATVLTTGAAYTGAMTDLVTCGSTTEADPRTMCDGGTTFLRFFVMKDGEPTGVTFDRTLSGAPYTVTDEAGLSVGNCIAQTTQAMSSVSAAAFTDPVECTSFAVVKPDCCDVQVQTSIGVITIPADVTSYATQAYKDPFSVTAATATGSGCDPADVSLTFNLSA